MKLFNKFFLILGLVSVMSMAAAPVMVGADLGFKSKYVWRGMPFNTKAVLWPDLWINWNEFTVTGFWSMDLTDNNGYAGNFTEFDLILDYSHSFKYAALSFGYFHFNYPHYQGFPSTGEFYAKFSTNMKIVNIGIDNYYDCLAAGGYYFSPKINVAHTIKELFTPSLNLSLGYGSQKHNLYYFGVNKSALTDFTGTVNLALVLPGNLGNNLSISTDFNISQILDEDLKAIYPDDDFNFWFGFYINSYFSVGGGE